MSPVKYDANKWKPEGQGSYLIEDQNSARPPCASFGYARRVSAHCMRRGPAKGLETKSYRDPEHPIQEVLVAVHHDDVRTRQAIARFLTTISYHNLHYKFARFLTGESMQAHRRTRVQYLRTGE
jgi:hypothetical protein